jgi:hypothetical protein
MKRAYLIYGLTVLGLWSAATVSGWELFGGRHGRIPQSARQSPGGYRSYNYWGGGK